MSVNKAEIWSLFERIVLFFPSFSGDAGKVESWHEVLQDIPFETALQNLKRHARTSKFPPSIAELIGNTEESSPHVPGVEETKAYLAERERLEQQIREERGRRAYGAGNRLGTG